MVTSVVTVKGQIVVPAKIRKRLRITKGTKVAIIEQADGFIVKPIDKKYFEQFAGVLPGKGKALRSLLRERRKDRRSENSRS